MPDVGDRVTLTLTVDPFDNSTSATATATSPPPANVPSSLITTPNADKSTWTANLDLTAAGEWKVMWEVTGTGANVEYDSVYAIAQTTGRSYATLTDLAAWLSAEPPPGSARRLVRATTKIDQLLVGMIYPVDDNGYPTDTDHVAALRDAVCAQVEWWVEIGDISGSGVSSWWKPVSTKASAAPKTANIDKESPARQQYAPLVVDLLREAGLLPIRAVIYG